MASVHLSGPRVTVAAKPAALGGLLTPSLVVPRWRRARGLVVRAATVVSPKYTSVKPLGDRVLVKINTSEAKSDGGILLPVSVQTRPQGGEVVAVGEGRSFGSNSIEISVPIGAQVVYSKYAGTELKFNDADHLILKEDDIIGILDGDDVKDLKPLNDRILIKRHFLLEGFNLRQCILCSIVVYSSQIQIGQKLSTFSLARRKSAIVHAKKQVAEAEEQTAGGLLLTQATKEKPSVGTVVAVGPGPLGEDGSRSPLSIAAGSNVMYSKYSGSEFKGEDGEYIVLRASDVMAVLS